MRVCLVGHHVDAPDEGVRNVTHYLFRELAKRHQVIRINIWKPEEWLMVSSHRPDIIHFVLGPSSVLSFVAAKTLSLFYARARTVMSAIQPFYPRFNRWMVLLRPDVVLVQSHAAERMFSSAGCKVTLVPHGVDTHRFAPTSVQDRMILREKYGVPCGKYVVLHVGAIKEGRNVHLLASLQSAERQVIIVGRPSEAATQVALEHLRQRGCLVWTDYFPELEEIYGLSNCYVFPCTNKLNSIELPLSVLEAMSCNLPVVTRRFGALPDIFTEDGGMVFAADDEGLIRTVCEMTKKKAAVATRHKVLPYSWDRIVRRVEAVYEQLVL